MSMQVLTAALASTQLPSLSHSLPGPGVLHLMEPLGEILTFHLQTEPGQHKIYWVGSTGGLLQLTTSHPHGPF